VTDLKQIMALGVMMTPALAVNGTIKVTGKCRASPRSKPSCNRQRRDPPASLLD